MYLSLALLAWFAIFGALCRVYQWIHRKQAKPIQRRCEFGECKEAAILFCSGAVQDPCCPRPVLSTTGAVHGPCCRRTVLFTTGAKKPEARPMHSKPRSGE
jgi:hypothetical protein